MVKKQAATIRAFSPHGAARRVRARLRLLALFWLLVIPACSCTFRTNGDYGPSRGPEDRELPLPSTPPPAPPHNGLGEAPHVRYPTL